MQCIVKSATDMYWQLSKIGYEIYIFNFERISSHSVFTWARMRGYVVIFRSQKESSNKSFWYTLF